MSKNPFYDKFDETLSKNPFDDDEVVSNISPKCATDNTQQYAQQLLLLKGLGFTESVALSSLQDTSGSIVDSLEILTKTVYSKFEMNDKYMPHYLSQLWISPISLRVSSWLPNYVESDSSKNYTKYTIVVSSRGYSWSVARRYKEFYQLHCGLSKLIRKHLKYVDVKYTPFPDDRLWFITRTVNDTVRNDRQRNLNEWMGSLLKPQLMLAKSTREYIYEFLEVDAKTAALKAAKDEVDKGVSKRISSRIVSELDKNPFDDH